MTLQHLSHMFNRAWRQAFEKRCFFFLAAVLALVGWLVVLCFSLAPVAGSWGGIALVWFPFFFAIGILLAAEVVLVRFYRERDHLGFGSAFIQSWEGMLSASYLAIPLLLASVLVWVLLGLFILLKEIPFLGSFFAVIFAFIPFLLFLSVGFLLLVAYALFFFIAPEIGAQDKFHRILLIKAWRRIRKDVFVNFLAALIAVLPFGIIVWLLTMATRMTKMLYHVPTHSLASVLQSLIVTLPFVLILTPAVNFFFNFATEACFTESEPEGESNHDSF